MRKTSKSLQLQIRVSPQEKAAIARYAKTARMGISQWVLSKALPSGQRMFQDLLSLMKSTSTPAYVLAQIHDMLDAASADEFEQMVAQPPGVALSGYWANYVAAMIEYTASRKGKKPPSWAGRVPPLETPVFGSELENLRLYLLTHSPPPFRRRNILIDAAVGHRV